MGDVEQAWLAVCELIYTHNNFSEPSSTRQHAIEELEKFREQSPCVVQVGLLLAAGTVPERVSALKLHCQQFGFYLLSGYIISRWEQTVTHDKNLFKEKLVQLIQEKLNSTWPRFIKEACAKVVVELAKREWPQTWPDMVAVLYNASSLSVSHKTFVMMIYLRLAEDIFELDSLLTLERKRDLRYSIVQTLENGFFVYIVDCFEKLNEASKNGTLTTDENELLACVLDTLNEFLSWLPANTIFANNEKLIAVFLDAILSQPAHLKTKIVGCLTNLFHNETCKCKPAILDFFSNQLFETFQAAAATADYEFFKAAGRFFCALSPHIVSLWDTVKSRQKLDISYRYFTFLLDLTRHPSQSVSSLTLDMWIRLLRHVSVKNSEPMKKIVPELIPVLRLRLLKVGLPSMNNHETCTFARQDFTSDEEFSSFFSLYRSLALQILLSLIPLNPDEVLMALQQSVNDCCSQFEKERNMGTKESESLLAAYIDGASILVGTCSSVLRNFVVTSGKLPSGLDQARLGSVASTSITSLIRVSTQIRGNLHLQVGCLELLVRLCRLCGHPDVLGDPNYSVLLVANEVLENVEFSTNISAAERPIDWMRQRCFIASFLVELASNHGKYLVLHFSSVFYPRLWRELEVLTREFGANTLGSFRADICLLCEALVLLGNHLAVDDRCVLIRNLITVVERIVAEFEPHLASTFTYARFIGLQGVQATENAVTPISEYIYRQNNLRFSARLLAGILRRFSGDVAAELHPLLQPLLPKFLAAIRVSMAIWAPDERVRAGVRPELMRAFDVSESDRKALLGVPPASSWVRSAESFDADDVILLVSQMSSVTDPTVMQKYRTFVQVFAEFSFQLLAHFAKIFGTLFYSSPNVGSELSAVLFTGLGQYPVPLLKTFIRAFLRPFVVNCPPAVFGDAVIPLLRPFVLHLNELLKQQWVDLEHSSETNQNEQTEIVETETTRQLTQEYLYFCYDILVFNPAKKSNSKNQAGGDQNDGASMDDSLIVENDSENAADGNNEESATTKVEMDGIANKGSGDGQQLPLVMSELGRLLFASHLDVAAALFETLVVAVGWPDTWSCSRSISTLRVILPVVLSEMRILPEIGPRGIMVCIARGFAVNGQHEEMRPGLIGLALVAYEYASLGGYHSHTAAMKELAGWNDAQLLSFENDVFALSEVSKTPKPTAVSGNAPRKPSARKTIREIKNRLSNVLNVLVGRPASRRFARSDAAPIATPVGTTTVAPAPGAIAEEKARRRAEQMLELDALFT